MNWKEYDMMGMPNLGDKGQQIQEVGKDLKKIVSSALAVAHISEEFLSILPSLGKEKLSKKERTLSSLYQKSPAYQSRPTPRSDRSSAALLRRRA